MPEQDVFFSKGSRKTLGAYVQSDSFAKKDTRLSLRYRSTVFRNKRSRVNANNNTTRKKDSRLFIATFARGFQNDHIFTFTFRTFCRQFTSDHFRSVRPKRLGKKNFSVFSTSLTKLSPVVFSDKQRFRVTSKPVPDTGVGRRLYSRPVGDVSTVPMYVFDGTTWSWV